MSAARPVLFVGGAHKSGTTALFTALAQHPRLAGQQAANLQRLHSGQCEREVCVHLPRRVLSGQLRQGR